MAEDWSCSFAASTPQSGRPGAAIAPGRKEAANMSERGKVVLVGTLIVGFVLGVYFYYRADYSHHKRLRAVEPGRFYRSGQLTAAGFTDAVKRLGLRTIINVQDDFPDPDLPLFYGSRQTI